MWMRPAVLLTVLVFGCALSACASKTGTSATLSGAPLESRLTRMQWTLQSATDHQGQSIRSLFPRADPRFTVEFKEGRVGIRGGCNAMGGSYQINAENRLQVGQMVATRKACMGGLMEADNALSAFLALSLQLWLDDGPAPTLRLVSAAGQTLVWIGASSPSIRP
jgi:heat shock protein HslJ